MRWTPGGRSDDLEDRRGEGGGRGLGGGGMRIGLGGVAVLFVLSMLTGQNLFTLLGPLLDGGVGTDDGGNPPVARQSSPEDEQQVQFVSFVLDDAQSVWTKLLPQYRRAKLVLFTDSGFA